MSLLMELLIKDSTDGVLLPVPQYPLYQGLLTRAGGVGVGYFLDVSFAPSPRGDACGCAPDRRR